MSIQLQRTPRAPRAARSSREPGRGRRTHVDRWAIVRLCLLAALSAPSMASAQYLGGLPQAPDVGQPVPSGPYLPVPRPQPQQEVFTFLGIRLFSTVGPTEASNEPAPPPSQTARR